jgi:hypothetical protein
MNWSDFKSSFCDVYCAVSPEQFYIKWNQLTTRFLKAKAYLDAGIYPCHEQWAWTFTSYQFMCGVWMDGHVEVENRMNKAIGGPKKVLIHFHGLNEKTSDQTAQELIHA